MYSDNIFPFPTSSTQIHVLSFTLSLFRKEANKKISKQNQTKQNLRKENTYTHICDTLFHLYIYLSKQQQQNKNQKNTKLETNTHTNDL